MAMTYKKCVPLDFSDETMIKIVHTAHYGSQGDIREDSHWNQNPGSLLLLQRDIITGSCVLKSSNVQSTGQSIPGSSGSQKPSTVTKVVKYVEMSRPVIVANLKAI